MLSPASVSVSAVRPDAAGWDLDTEKMLSEKAAQVEGILDLGFDYIYDFDQFSQILRRVTAMHVTRLHTRM